ncbi:MAG TPA: hypothetical protein DCG69_02390 [Bacteroidales bacterium]|nr:hypothetical protein [Bacteroidales bacterium]
MKHKTTIDFSRIEPYDDAQVHDALVRILNNPAFQHIIDKAFPKEMHAKLRQDLLAAQSSLEFQKLFMYTGLKLILKNTSPTGLRFSGESYIADGRAVSYIANHRDILLDSALLQVILVDLGLETSEISFGSNLIVNDFVNDLGRINRMFTVFRDGSPREMLQNAKDLSAYIHHTLKEKKRSIWIAHRKGRAKDGVDKTDLGVLKMLVSSGGNKIDQAIQSLDIIPVSISYEWEPCDASKVKEIYFKEKGGGYTKSPNEDMESLIHGILGKKGGIHISFCQPVNEVLDAFDSDQGNNPYLNQIVAFIDNEIIENYKLWPSNYFAFDLSTNSKQYELFYDSATVAYFEERINKAIEIVGENPERVRELFIDLYANPLRSKLKISKEDSAITK